MVAQIPKKKVLSKDNVAFRPYREDAEEFEKLLSETNGDRSEILREAFREHIRKLRASFNPQETAVLAHSILG